MSKVAKLKIVETDDFSLGDDVPYAIPNREWEMKFISHETSYMFGHVGKLTLRFEIIEPGEYMGMRMSVYYNVELTEKPRKGGRFKPALSSKFIRDYIRVNGPLKRHDRLSMLPFKNRIILATTRTVTHDSKNRDLGVACYSVIEQLRVHPDHGVEQLGN